jgi:hypothetical protein
MFNLYTDPKEDVSIGIRHLPMAVPVLGAASSYMKELIKYPPQFKVGFLSNNPPSMICFPRCRRLMAYGVTPVNVFRQGAALVANPLNCQPNCRQSSSLLSI